MAKIVDITNKLDFDANPKLIIKGKEYEVNADAETVLKVMGEISSIDKIAPKSVVKMYELIFSEGARKDIAKLKLQFNDFQKVVESAIDLIVGNDEKQGE